METVESLKRKVGTAEDLQSVVRTMKALAAVSIRQYEQAVKALEEYGRTIELGLRAVLREGAGRAVWSRRAPRQRLGAVVFGSDQGMCGQLNDQTVTHSLESLDAMGIAREDRVFLVVGLRVAGQLEHASETIEEVLTVPGSATSIGPAVADALVTLQRWRDQQGLDHILLFHSRPLSGATFEPHTVNLLPLDLDWLERLEAQKWPTRSLPLYTMDREALFSSLVREHLFVSLYRAFAESLASENASRLASMQAAEKNVDERLRELSTQYHQQRQMSITSELLDIVAGFEALTGKGVLY
jgi:F-type H+-transporting ATPase subunit gamma